MESIPEAPFSAVPPPLPPTPPAPRALPMTFTGSGGEYFGIWIVNLLLSIVTLGIYSAWAKVRRLQYFYRHTQLAESSFDFHGRPGSILIGRVVALVLLLFYSYGTRHPSKLTFGIILVIGLAMPWLLRNSLRFRLYNSSWRGLRFSFHGSVAGAYRVFLLNGILTAITLYLLAPFFHHRLKRYQHDHSSIGRSSFRFDASLWQFYRIYLLLLGAIVLAGFAFSMIAGGAFVQIMHAPRGTMPDPHVLNRISLAAAAVTVAMSLLIGPLLQTMLTNLTWNHTTLGPHRIECRQSALRLMWIQISNLLLMVLTLGLFHPWALVRVARFRLEAITIIAASDLTEFEAADASAATAIGEETASLFDFDISL